MSRSPTETVEAVGDHAGVGAAEEADVDEEVVELEGGTAPLPAVGEGPRLPVGPPHPLLDAPEEGGEGELHLPVREAHRRVDEPGAVDDVPGPEIPVDEGRLRAVPVEEVGERAFARVAEAPGEVGGDGGVGEVDTYPVLGEETPPRGGPRVRLGERADDVVEPVAELGGRVPVDVGEGGSEPLLIGGPLHPGRDEPVLPRLEDLGDGGAGGGEGGEPVGLEAGVVRCFLHRRRPPVGEDGPADRGPAQISPRERAATRPRAAGRTMPTTCRKASSPP